MSVNKLLTFINHNRDRRKEDNSSLDEVNTISLSYITSSVSNLVNTIV